MAALAEQLPSLTPEQAADVLARASPQEALGVLTGYAREASAQALQLLLSLLDLAETRPDAIHVPVAAAEALGYIPIQEAADAAAPWASLDPDKSVANPVRKAARRALLRLAQRGLQPRVAPVTQRVSPKGSAGAALAPEPVRQALMSAVDGQGLRLLYLLVRLPGSGGHCLRAVVSEREGVLQFHAHPSTGRQFERLVTEHMQRGAFTLATIPPEYARRLIGEAVAAGVTAGKGVPPTYATFREVLSLPLAARADAETPESAHAQSPGAAPAQAASPIYEALDAASVRYQPDLVEASVALLERPEFAGWVPDGEQVEALATEWVSIGRGPLVLPPATLVQRREDVMHRVIDLVLGPGGAPRFRRRLEDNALVLLRSGSLDAAARQALAAAVALEPAATATARRHPLVRAIAARAMQLAVGDNEAGDGSDSLAAWGSPSGAPEASRLILPR